VVSTTLGDSFFAAALRKADVRASSSPPDREMIERKSPTIPDEEISAEELGESRQALSLNVWLPRLKLRLSTVSRMMAPPNFFCWKRSRT